MPIITVAIEKGGVGKTATVTNLAAVFASQGKRTLVIDVDSQCNSTYFLTGYKKNQNMFRNKGVAEMLRVYGQNIDPMHYVQETQMENLYIIPSNAATASIPDILSLLARDYRESENRFLAYCLEPLVDNFEYIIIDTPPNLELATTNALVACDYVLIPFNCEEQALDGLQNTDEVRKRLEKEEEASIQLLGIVLTMVERAALTRDMREMLEQSIYGPYLLKTEIRKGQAVKESSSYGKPVVVTNKSSNPAKDYVALADEINTIIDKQGRGD